MTVPEVQAQAAILYDVTNKRVLYEKDARSRYYPASITKLMTALLVAENTTMDQMVTFSETATTNLEAGAVGLNVTAGDVISVKDCLYGMLLKSANEVANGLAEFVGGSISGFADMMNARAQALGCTGTHFANPNGLNDSNHYTTAYDMALIAAEAFRNPTVCQITSTVNYTFPATKKVSTARALTMGHKMITSQRRQYYPGIVGGKTGYTSLAGNTLVTCAERDGLRLVVVILKSKQTHYDDTKALLDIELRRQNRDRPREAGRRMQTAGASSGPTEARRPAVSPPLTGTPIILMRTGTWPRAGRAWAAAGTTSRAAARWRKTAGWRTREAGSTSGRTDISSPTPRRRTAARWIRTGAGFSSRTARNRINRKRTGYAGGNRSSGIACFVAQKIERKRIIGEPPGWRAPAIFSPRRREGARVCRIPSHDRC